MQKFTVSRNDDVYEAFADIAQATDGTLVCTYRESLCHAPTPWSKVIVRRSYDRGFTWGLPQVVMEQSEDDEGQLNCSRIASCRDGTLLLIVDLQHRAPGRLEPDGAENLLFRSRDHGASWQGPEQTGIADAIGPSLKELSNGNLIVGLTEHDLAADGKTLVESQTTYLSRDGGKTWEGPSRVPDPPMPTVNGRPWRLNEGDFAELDDGPLILYMREDAEGLSGWKSISRDGGRSWSRPVRTHMMHCLGRPSVGRLWSGEIAITYRITCGLSVALGLHVETPREAGRGFADDGDSGTAAADDIPEVRFAFIDNDRSLCTDSGYSGWVQLPDGDLYVVNYINDDAPRAHIRGYRMGREDWYLFPEGAVKRNWPGEDEDYVADGQAMTREQQAWVANQNWQTRVHTQK